MTSDSDDGRVSDLGLTGSSISLVVAYTRGSRFRLLSSHHCIDRNHADFCSGTGHWAVKVCTTPDLDEKEVQLPSMRELIRSASLDLPLSPPLEIPNSQNGQEESDQESATLTPQTPRSHQGLGKTAPVSPCTLAVRVTPP